MRSQRTTTAVIESLENRQLFSDSVWLSASAPINTFDGVGFHENPVAYVTYMHNGKGATSAAGLTAQVNFGDGTGWHSGNFAYLGTAGSFAVKADHTYAAGVAKTFYVETKVTATGVSADLKNSTIVYDKLLTAPAARGGTPLWPRMPWATLTDVKLWIGNTSPVNTYSGVGFNRNQVAYFSSTVLSVPDNNITHYHAQLNFGDANGWYNADITRQGTLSTSFIVKNRTHVYAKAGTYPVTLILTGPDGTTLAQEVCDVYVKDMPMPASRPTQAAPNASIGSAQDVSLWASASGNLNAHVGKALTNVQVGYVSATIASMPDYNAAGYMVFINWGDSPTWNAGSVVANSNLGPMKLLGTHTYAKSGTYQLVVHILAPDGTSLTLQTVMVYVV